MSVEVWKLEKYFLIVNFPTFSAKHLSTKSDSRDPDQILQFFIVQFEFSVYIVHFNRVRHSIAHPT